MAEQSKMSVPTTFFVLSLQLFDIPTDQKYKIHFGFFIWSSIQFQLFAKNDFQYGVFKIFSTLFQKISFSNPAFHNFSVNLEYHSVKNQSNS
jgi:hypothetical protein